MEERFILLESKVADQDRIIEELNSVVVRQQNQIDKMEEQMRLLTSQLQIGDPYAATAERRDPNGF